MKPDQKEKLRELFASKTQIERIELLQDGVRVLRQNLIKRNKASKRLRTFTGERRGIRGGRLTTLSENFSTACEMYVDQREYVKTIIEFI